jgi:isopentenyl diphosphate isomerase/L-lactate dehydrogenase-like FMN-dependent dehydrogenase
MHGGIRRGTDIFEALARGADAVCSDRPYLSRRRAAAAA